MLRNLILCIALGVGATSPAIANGVDNTVVVFDDTMQQPVYRRDRYGRWYVAGYRSVSVQAIWPSMTFIKPGETVRFVNRSNRQFKLEGTGDGNRWATGYINTGQSTSRTFTENDKLEFSAVRYERRYSYYNGYYNNRYEYGSSKVTYAEPPVKATPSY